MFAAGLAVVVAGGLGAWAVGTAGLPDAATGSTGSQERAAVAGDAAVSLCGVADIDRYVALSEDAPTVEVSALAEISGPVPSVLATTDDAVAALVAVDDTTTITRWSTEGAPELTVTVQADAGDPPSTFALAPDGDVLAPLGHGEAAVGRWHDDSGPDVTYDLSGLDRGEIIGVMGWTADRDDAVAAVAFGDDEQLALLLDDGTVEPDGPSIPRGWYVRYFPQDDGTLAVLSDADAESSTITLARYDADGEEISSITGPLWDESPNGRPAALDHPTGVATGPDGGLLLAGPTWRLLEIGDDGVWNRMALSGEGQSSTFELAALTPFVRQDDAYYFFSPSTGGAQLSRVTTADLQLLLDAPVTYDINHASTLDRLGFGIGLSTSATYDYFTAEDEPVVKVEFDDWWGPLSDTYELRYRVTGDPNLVPAVEPTSGTIAIPSDGGAVSLTLPEARPGPYDVSAQLVERESGDVRTATCLRYAVGAPDATFDPDGLAQGADWGGAGPLRGVQLADELGVGSHRVQLDFGRLVPDVTATPALSALDLSSLPGATDADPFADIDAAGRLAATTGVELYVQVGQGGSAEADAVANGTWGAWVGVIAQAFRAGAPSVHVWAPWNEPNNTGFSNGADYATRVLAPFATALRGVDPAAQIVGGNALNVVVEWYQQVVDAGGCDSWDIVGIHPYSGYNRSWDEEGSDGPIGQITALRDVLASCEGGTPPMWDTESGWWSDGPGNHWAQGYDIARSLLWMRTLGVDEWMYFFSEGGWGEGGFSWSLVQLGSFVKPGALAMATTSRMLEGRGAPTVVETGIPASHAMQLGPADDPMLAVWTEDLTVAAHLTSTEDGDVRVTDVYGGSTSIGMTAAEPVTLTLSGSPVFLTSSTGSALTLSPIEPFGENVLEDGTVTASSTTQGSDPAAVLRSGGAGTSPWRAGPTTVDGPDTSPWLQVDLAAPVTIDRVLVSSAGIRCCTSGLRTFTVSVLDADGTWRQVGGREDLFHERSALIEFDPLVATAVRLEVPSTTLRDETIPSANYSGQTAGLLPAWEPLRSEPTWPVSVTALAAYASDDPTGTAISAPEGTTEEGTP